LYRTEVVNSFSNPVQLLIKKLYLEAIFHSGSFVRRPKHQLFLNSVCEERSETSWSLNKTPKVEYDLKT